jgi:hypothetical protein
MAYGTLQTDVINSSTGVFSTNNAYTGIAKAWVYFNGSSAAISASYNVSSVTRNTTGDYTINMTTALASSSYAISGSARTTSTNGLGVVVPVYDVSAPTTTAFRIQVIGTSSFILFDSPYTSVAVFSS